MGAIRPQKIYTLDNGVKITPSALAQQLRCSVPSARCRLDKYTDHNAVFRVVGASRPKRQYKCKEYTLSDGSRQTARQVADKYNVPLCTIRNRLSNGITAIHLLKKLPNSNKQHRLGKVKVVSAVVSLDSKQKVSQLIKGRNFFCPLSRLLLRVI